MSALELPPPTKRYEGDDVLETAGATAVDGSSTQGVKKSETLLKGMIYPSREIRGESFELRDRARSWVTLYVLTDSLNVDV